ncbi:HDOD domain-containing protein [Marinibactrum halimedae]|uniref:Signal transduction protein with HDOD/GAF domains n=1 Tax=Marinibactrum halimedae TaxID=1444977 RepID=A0AA37WMW1_9GAMM|nr:HDOD domain-containing protein [Marinibactrum halimedae]MCD9461081.1 HDOD domain-containing protein [Marinibactrum halimedae]GLS26748.1 signal transduction protein with HDOD/GAF domains [Marinibactrum halimedae]
MATGGARSWVERLSQVEMPALATVVKELNDLTGDDDSSVNHLAEVILRDSNLTSQVLKISNSVQYNPTSIKVNTVSRAIVLIGFDGVRAICISLMLIETLLASDTRNRLLQCMADAFHAASQARTMLSGGRAHDIEQAFIATLLFHLGEMAFWASSSPEAEELDRLLRESNLTLKEASTEVLGASFLQITRGLAELWKLGDTLKDALAGRNTSACVVAVRLADQLSRASKNGWDSTEARGVMARIAEFTKQPVREVIVNCRDTADEAVALAVSFGAAKVCHLIPSGREKEGSVSDRSSKKIVLDSDPKLQLNILRELSSSVSELDVNTAFQMVLEGLHRGVGLERVMVCFIQKDLLFARYVLGEGTSQWREKIRINLNSEQGTLFHYAISRRHPIWLGESGRVENLELYTDVLRSVIGCYPSFMSVVRLGSRDVAVFYADRWDRGGKLDSEQFDNFTHFIQQLNSTLKLLAGKTKG